MAEHEMPPTPWTKGKHEGHSVFNLEVEICEVDKGGVRMVFTQHDFQSVADEKVCRALKSMGEEQIAYALLLNALRREMFIETLLHIQQDPTFLSSYKEADEEEQRNREVEVAAKMVTTLDRAIRKMAPEVAREILAMVTSQ